MSDPVRHPRAITIENGKIHINHLSPSSIEAFAGPYGCELAWYYRYIERRPAGAFGGALLAGRGWDTAMLTAHDQPWVEPDEAAEAFLDEIEHTLARTDEEWDVASGDLSVMRNRGPLAAKAYVERELPQIHALATQKKIAVRFKEVDWPVIGYIDRLEARPAGGVAIADDKATLSTSRKWDEDAANTSLQLNVYALACAQESIAASSIGYRSARLLKTKQELKQAFVPITEEAKARTVEIIAAVGDRIEHACETGVFVPTAYIDQRWKCSQKFCSWYSSCEFGAKARMSASLAQSAREAGL